MKESLNRYAGLASICLLGASSFAACQGLDSRKVTKDPSGTGNQASGGDNTSSGGSSAMAGDTGSPFGGNLFEGGAPPVLEGPPHVVKVDPADMATDVDVNSDVSLLFSEAIAPATVTTDSVKLMDGAIEVEGAVALDPDTSIIGTIDPTRRLALAAKYDVSASAAITDTTGTALDPAFSSSFTTRDGRWDDVNLPFVEDPAVNWGLYTDAFLGIDDRGNVLVAWPQYDVNYNQQVWARWYRQATGWQPVVQLSDGTNGTGYPSVAVSEEGDATVVWFEYAQATSSYNVMARRYLNGAWSDAPEVTNGTLMMTNLSEGPFVKMRGGKMIVWWGYRYINGTFSSDYIYAQSTTYDGAWLPNPLNLGYANTSNSYLGYTNVAMDPTGNAMLLYTVISTATNVPTVNFTKYVATTNDWENSAPIDIIANLSPYYVPAIAFDDAGAAMVVWPTSTAPLDMMASRYTKAKGFSAALPLDDLDTQPDPHRHYSLASDGTDFYASWLQPVGATTNAYGARYSTADGTWTASQLLSDGDTSIAQAPMTTADKHGNAMALWLQGAYSQVTMYDSVQYSYARYLKGATSWAKPALVVGGKNFNQYSQQSAVAAGNGIIGLLVIDYGLYHADTMTSDPGQPLLNIFQ